MEKIVFTIKFLNYFDELIFLLFEKKYFSYSENATECVDKIIDFINTQIFIFLHKQTPKFLQHFGKFYIFLNQMKELSGLCFLRNQMIEY